MNGSLWQCEVVDAAARSSSAVSSSSNHWLRPCPTKVRPVSALATENAGPQPPAFGRVGQLQHYTVVFLCAALAARWHPVGGGR